jgi:hypothetical protein
MYLSTLLTRVERYKKTMNQLTDLHKIWYEYNDTTRHPTFMLQIILNMEWARSFTYTEFTTGYV